MTITDNRGQLTPSGVGLNSQLLSAKKSLFKFRGQFRGQALKIHSIKNTIFNT